MKKDKLENGIKELKGIMMTPTEKKRIFDNVLNSSPVLSKQPIKSPWSIHVFISLISKNRMAYYVIVPMLVILTGGGAVFASQDSLPNSILYPIKVKIVEPIKGAAISKPEARAKYESTLATKRLVEAETLASLGKLDFDNENKINVLLENHTNSFNKALSKVNQVESHEQSDEIVSNFNAEMKAHARVLDIITEKEKRGKNIDKKNQISETARYNANKIIDTLKNKEAEDEIQDEDKKDEDLVKYNKKRTSVKYLIDETLNNLDNASGERFSSDRKIIDDTNKTLTEAKIFLEEADKSDKEGDSEEAYKNLIDSESSVKEANIFLNAGLKFKDQNHENNKKWNNGRWNNDD